MSPEEVIARALLNYIDPPGRTLWGAERSEDKARAVLSALKSAGLVVVPEEPTEAMVRSCSHAEPSALGVCHSEARAIYSSMIHAYGREG